MLVQWWGAHSSESTTLGEQCCDPLCSTSSAVPPSKYLLCHQPCPHCNSKHEKSWGRASERFNGFNGFKHCHLPREQQVCL